MGTVGIEDVRAQRPEDEKPNRQRGIFLGGGGSVRIARLIGAPRVMDMMLTGRTHSAEEGHAAGVTQYLVEDGEGLKTRFRSRRRRRRTRRPPISPCFTRCRASRRATRRAGS